LSGCLATEELTGDILGRKHRLHLADNAGVALMERLKQRKQERVFLPGRHSQPILVVGVAEDLRWGLADILSGKLKIAIWEYRRTDTDRGFTWPFHEDNLKDSVRHGMSGSGRDYWVGTSTRHD
jgi:hypothetical protein